MCHKTDYDSEGDETTLTGKVREADKVFWQCRKSVPNPQKVDYVVLALYRHMTEMADGNGHFGQKWHGWANATPPKKRA